MRTAYSDDKSLLGKWLKMFFGLPFLPYQIVEDGFVELVGDCSDEDGLEFSDYVLNNYIQPHCIFPTNIWAEEPSINKRYHIFINYKKNLEVFLYNITLKFMF